MRLLGMRHRHQPWLAALSALSAAAVITSCGSNGSKTSPTPATSSANAVGVTVAFAAPRTGSVRQADVLQFKATAAFADGSSGDCTEAAAWASSNEQVARVNPQKRGEVTAVAGGDATISAVCGSLKASFSVSVLGVTQLTAALPSGRANALIIGERVPLIASAQFADGTTEACSAGTATWTSSDVSIVTVSADGTAQALAPGNATITSTCRFSSNSLSLGVRPGLRIRGLENEPFVLLAQPRINIYTDLLNANGTIGASCQATFTSSDLSVLTVSPAGSGGTIVPRKLGEATITATCGANAATTTVRVAHYNIAGTVRKSDGTPLAGASVGTYRSQYSDLGPIAETVSAADGSYVLPADRSPAYIAVRAEGYHPATLPPATWTRQPTMQVADTQLSPTPQPQPAPPLVNLSDAVCNAANFTALCPGTTLVKGAQFQVAGSGRLRVETTLDSVPANTSVVVALYCGSGSSADLPYEWESNTVRYYQVSASCPTYSLRVSNMSDYPRVTFHIVAAIR